MRLLKMGSTGPQVQFLQLALIRAGFDPESIDGVFGGATRRALVNFQSKNALVPDGVAGPATHAALSPWYLGSASHLIRPGDTLYRIATIYGSTVMAIETANPGLDPLNLQPGQMVTVPLSFPVVPTNVDYFSQLIDFCCRGIALRYPAVSHGSIGNSVMGRPLHSLTIGSGRNPVLYNASHHANEWITTPLLMKFFEELARAQAFGLNIGGSSAREMLRLSRLAVIPAVNPDGIDLVSGEVRSGSFYNTTVEISRSYPSIPFPEGWKANILGTDLNLQYPAGWETAKEIKYAQGFTGPAPRDFVGYSPLSAPESRAMYDFTRAYSPVLTLSYHSQGEVIYWKYLDLEPPGSRELALAMGMASGYTVEETPYASGHAGYKDWFILDFDRPGYTIEVGLGKNPLPLSQFDRIYRDNLGILTIGLGAEI